VGQRSHELGVRIALGARTSHIVLLVLGESLSISSIAAAIGIAGAIGAGRWIAPLLFNASPQDPRVLGGVAIGLIVVAAGAALVPALRASRVDPNVALRAE
jgi:ABC-type antimicrobial peptide transport system permease subunit